MTRGFFEGKRGLPKEVEALIFEHILASEYGWDEDVINKMDYTKVMHHVQICLARDNVRQEFELLLSGAKMRQQMAL